MKSRLTLIFAALVVLLGAMVWVVQDRGTVIAAADPVPAVTFAPLRSIAPAAIPQPTAPIHNGQAAGYPPASVPAAATGRLALPGAAEPQPAEVPAGQSPSAPSVRVEASGDLTYVALAGDTVSQLAIALLGSDSREHRDAVIDANRSLHADPDRVLAGETYSIDPSSTPAGEVADGDGLPSDVPVAAAAEAGPSKFASGVTSATRDATSDKPAGAAGGRKMTYMARIGDTVRVLAAHLLGGDTKANRNAIVAGNASLQRDPDHLVAGENYTIVAPDGLADDPDAPKQQASTTEPEADEVLRLGTGRLLRYTARPGDTVSKLAAALLGGDTRANRDSIINDNPELKDDPDHLVAGQTYWITAPMAE